MADETPLKSAYDLAMERLRAKDREEGTPEAAPLTDAQKKEITRLRQEAEAKIAELEILHRKNRMGVADPGKLLEIEDKHRIDKARVESRLESAVRKVREGS